MKNIKNYVLVCSFDFLVVVDGAWLLFSFCVVVFALTRAGI